MYLISFKYSWEFLLCGAFEGGGFEVKKKSPTLIKKKEQKNNFGNIQYVAFRLCFLHTMFSMEIMSILNLMELVSPR